MKTIISAGLQYTHYLVSLVVVWYTGTVMYTVFEKIEEAVELVHCGRPLLASGQVGSGKSFFPKRSFHALKGLSLIHI